MNGFRNVFLALSAMVFLLSVPVFQAEVVALGPKVSEDKNKHNLSSAVFNEAEIQLGSTLPNPSVLTRPTRDSSVKFKATYDVTNNRGGLQICVFCHTPHNANVVNQAPLWNRKFSSEIFSRYSSDSLQIRVNPAISSIAQYTAGTQPDGSSKLCLSCHDGVSKLGDVIRGGPITMEASAGDVITGIASFNPSTNKMKTGHHPVSFVYSGTVQQAISSARLTGGFQLPTAVPQVKLDKNNKMQCTTCHNPHQNQSDDSKCYDTESTNTIVDCDSSLATRKVVPFWVYGVSGVVSTDHDAVCTSCHDMHPRPFYPRF